MLVGRLPKPGLCPTRPEVGTSTEPWHHAVSRVLVVAGASESAGVDSERNGTPSARTGASGSALASTGAPRVPAPSDLAPRRCLPA
jgi:hypothetical protein